MAILVLTDLDIGNDLVLESSGRIILVEEIDFAFCLSLSLVMSNQTLVVVGHWTAVGLAILLRIDKRTEFDEVGDWIQLNGVGLTTKTQGFEGNGATTSKWIEYPGRIPFSIQMQELMSSGDKLTSQFDVVGII